MHLSSQRVLGLLVLAVLVILQTGNLQKLESQAQMS